MTVSSIRVGNHFGLQNYNDQTIEVKKKKENKNINLLTAKLIRQIKKNYVSNKLLYLTHDNDLFDYNEH